MTANFMFTAFIGFFLASSTVGIQLENPAYSLNPLFGDFFSVFLTDNSMLLP